MIIDEINAMRGMKIFNLYTALHDQYEHWSMHHVMIRRSALLITGNFVFYSPMLFDTFTEVACFRQLYERIARQKIVRIQQKI